MSRKWLIYAGMLWLGLFSSVGSSAQTEKRLFHRGEEHLRRRAYEKAELDFSMVLQLDRTREDAFFNRGYARFCLKDYVAAIEDFNRVIDLDPEYEKAYYLRGICKLGLENYVEAVKDLNLALRFNPKNDLYYQARAKAKAALEDFRGAVSDLTEAIHYSKGKKLRYFFDRAQNFVKLRAYENALRDLTYVLRKQPRNSDAYFARASVRLQAGDREGACIDWSKAGELGDLNAYQYIREHCNQ
jgi:tetratricopeptide (TPR) repeat protein